MKRLFLVLNLFMLVGMAMVFFSETQVYGQKGQPLIFRRHAVLDQQLLGMEIFRMLVPKDWKFEGGSSWNYGVSPPELITAYTVSSPDGHSVIQQFPPIRMYWAPDQMLQSTQMQLGYGIMQPVPASDFLQRIFIPQVRQGVSDLKIVETQPLPEMAQSALALSQLSYHLYNQILPLSFVPDERADAVRVKVEYSHGGRKMVEDFTTVIIYSFTNVPTLYGAYVQTVSWRPAVFSFRAPAEEMAEKVRLFQISLYSRFENPVFNVTYIRLCAVITRENIQHQQAILARYQQIRQTLSETNDMVWQSYQNRSAGRDRMFENYTQAYRGMESYYDPVNRWNVSLPAGYENAWTNGTDYVFSDTPNFNPGAVLSGSWQRMERKK